MGWLTDHNWSMVKGRCYGGSAGVIQFEDSPCLTTPSDRRPPALWAVPVSRVWGGSAKAKIAVGINAASYRKAVRDR